MERSIVKKGIPSLVHFLKPQDARERLWRYTDVLLKEPIQIALGVASLGCEFLEPHHSVSLGEQIKGVIEERILLCVLLKQVRQGALKKHNLLLRVFRILDPILEPRSLRTEYLFEAHHPIGDFMHAQLEQVVQSFWCQFYSNGAGIRRR